jgi:hypothetical protein
MERLCTNISFTLYKLKFKKLSQTKWVCHSIQTQIQSKHKFYFISNYSDTSADEDNSLRNHIR